MDLIRNTTRETVKTINNFEIIKQTDFAGVSKSVLYMVFDLSNDNRKFATAFWEISAAINYCER